MDTSGAENRLAETEALLKRCQWIEGMSFLQLASFTGYSFPESPTQRKGWVGQTVERILGATAGGQSIPDFQHLGIELKTIPFNEKGIPIESTFVTRIPLLTIHQQQWETSQCYAKLKCVLWVPIEGGDIPFEQRRIGKAFLWSPSVEQKRILAQDWEDLTERIGTGCLDEVHSGMGRYLQVRPKAANGKSLCYAFDQEGCKILTLPRGFYLRSSFTRQLMILG